MSGRLRVVDELGAELDRAARRRASEPERRRGSSALAAVGALVAVAVAFAAIVGFGHRSRPPVGPGSRASAVPAAARGLLAELAVLRRPQTSADRDLPAADARALNPGVVPSLTRLAGTIGGNRVYLLVSAGGCRNGGDQVWAMTVSPRGRFAYGVGVTAAQLMRFAIIPTGLDGVMASVVPDGVRRVEWHLYPPRTVSVRPANNAAALRVGSGKHVSLATWRLAGGRVLSSRQETIAACPPPLVSLGSAATPVPRSLGERFALFGKLPPSPLAIATTYANYFTGWKLGLNFAQARFVHTGAGMSGRASGVWVVPGARGLCIMEGIAGSYSGGNGVCTAAGYGGPPDSGGMRFSDIERGGRNTYAGLVPDGNRSVELVLPDGKTRRVPVVENVYAVTIRGQAIALLDRNDRGGPERFPLSANYNMF